ncbi:hypothetical protein ACG1BZ_15790 [Microbulbifer sp. CNSA002]|uniref:hypothetical protein n=1 Tax=unclassified Microbulbifer TaxID=2619833 RepID=UPI0039B5B297
MEYFNSERHITLHQKKLDIAQLNNAAEEDNNPNKVGSRVEQLEESHAARCE